MTKACVNKGRGQCSDEAIAQHLDEQLKEAERFVKGESMMDFVHVKKCCVEALLQKLSSPTPTRSGEQNPETD